MGFLGAAIPPPDNQTQPAPFWSQFATAPTGGGATTSQGAPLPSQTNGPPTPGGSGQDPHALIQQWQSQHPYGSPGSSIQDLNTYLQSQGVQSSIPTHAGGTQLSTDKIVLPDQSVWDISNDNGWQTPNNDGYWVNGQPSSTPGVVTSSPDMGSGSPFGGGQLGGPYGGLVNGQGLINTPFTPPTGVDEQNDPGFQFAIDQANKAIQGSAAAKGTLLSGGTLKDLANQDIGMAQQDYANVFNRALQSQQQNYNQQLGTAQFNTGNLWNFANLGENAAAQTGAAGQNYANAATGLFGNLGNAGAANAAATGNAFNTGLTGSAQALLNAYIQSRYPNGMGSNQTNQTGSPYMR